MSSPWSAPDAGNTRPGPVPPPPPPGVHDTQNDLTGPTAAVGTGPVEANPFAPPSDDDVVPVVPGSQYGGPVVPGAYGTAPVWPTMPGHDPLAIAALVCGIAGMIILPLPFSPVALGLGIAALVRISRGLRRGKGMAIAGVVLGGLGTLGLLAMGAFFGIVFFLGAGA